MSRGLRDDPPPARARGSARAAPPELLALARELVGPGSGSGSGIYFAPGIPREKEARAREVHEAHLPSSEPILVLYDATIFGGAENGFVVTPERLCWKNLLDHPRQVPWAELDPRSVIAQVDRIGVAGGGVQASGELVSGAARLFLAMVERYVRPDAGPYRSSADASLPGGVDRKTTRVTSLARLHVGEIEQIYYQPAIPGTKLRNARAVHAGHLDREEPVAVLYDDTVFGSAKDGFVVTPRRLCWKNVVNEAASREWRELDPGAVTADGNLVHVGSASIQLTARADIAPRVASLFAAIAAEVRSDRGG